MCTSTCQLTFTRDKGLPKGVLQRAVPMQESVAGRDGHMGGAVNGLRGGCVCHQLFSCVLSFDLVGGNKSHFMSQSFLWAVWFLSHTPWLFPPCQTVVTLPDLRTREGRGEWDRAWQVQRTVGVKRNKVPLWDSLLQGPPPGTLRVSNWKTSFLVLLALGSFVQSKITVSVILFLAWGKKELNFPLSV
jgi:hypothetical protein